jgi:hypothetical protein
MAGFFYEVAALPPFVHRQAYICKLRGLIGCLAKGACAIVRVDSGWQGLTIDQ